MQYRTMQDEQRRVLVVVCGKGDDPVRAVTEAVRDAGVRAAQVTGVGGFHSAELGYFDRERREYLPSGWTRRPAWRCSPPGRTDRDLPLAAAPAG